MHHRRKKNKHTIQLQAVDGISSSLHKVSQFSDQQPGNIVPGRPSQAELRAMALRQQQQIDSQHQLLAAKEQRLRFLKAQEVRGAAAAAEGERLRRLRERKYIT
uniref:Uncharacterized protein n=1 Tax=Megaselia scalaris TaxID=36166 RepID=T1GFT1_MEGSC